MSNELELKGGQLRGIEQHMLELEEEHAALTASVRDLTRKVQSECINQVVSDSQLPHKIVNLMFTITY